MRHWCGSSRTQSAHACPDRKRKHARLAVAQSLLVTTLPTPATHHPTPASCPISPPLPSRLHKVASRNTPLSRLTAQGYKWPHSGSAEEPPEPVCRPAATRLPACRPLLCPLFCPTGGERTPTIKQPSLVPLYPPPTASPLRPTKMDAPIYDDDLIILDPHYAAPLLRLRACARAAITALRASQCEYELDAALDELADVVWDVNDVFADEDAPALDTPLEVLDMDAWMGEKPWYFGSTIDPSLLHFDGLLTPLKTKTRPVTTRQAMEMTAVMKWMTGASSTRSMSSSHPSPPQSYQIQRLADLPARQPPQLLRPPPPAQPPLLHPALSS